MKFSKIMTMMLMLFVSLTASALDIDAVKEQGLVGETRSGYIAAVPESPSADIANLVTDINTKRKQKYQAIAKKRGIPLAKVEELAAKKAYEKTQKGHFVLSKEGKWLKK